MVHLRTITSGDAQSKHIGLVLLDYQSVDIWCTLPLKRIQELLVELRLQVINLILSRLDSLVLFRWLPINIHAINESFLEFILLVRHLVLIGLSAHKWLIHSILVMQCRHLSSPRAIIVSK